MSVIGQKTDVRHAHGLEPIFMGLRHTIVLSVRELKVHSLSIHKGWRMALGILLRGNLGMI